MLVLAAPIFNLYLPKLAVQNINTSLVFFPSAFQTSAMNIEVLIVPLLFIAFSVGFLLVCAYCINTARQTRTLGVIMGDSIRANAESQLRKGMDSDMISAFPIVAYSEIKKMNVGKGLVECTVCLCEYGDGDSVRLLPKCDHAFHPACIDSWLTNHVTCPICRINLLGEDDKAVESSDMTTPGAFTQEINHVVINIDEERRPYRLILTL